MYEAIEYQHCRVIDSKLSAQGKASSNPGVKCTHCKSQFTGGPFRIRGHILRITKRGGGACTSDTAAAQDAREFFQKVEDGLEADREKKRKRMELKSITNASGTGGSTDDLVQISIETAFLPGLRAAADAALARYVYAEGVPFLKTGSPYFQERLTAVGAYGRGYKAPSIKKLRTSMLDREVDSVKEQLKVRVRQICSAALLNSAYYRSHCHGSIKSLVLMQPFDEAMKRNKCSLPSDGWQDAHKRPLLNVCAVTPLGSTFIKAVDTTGETKVHIFPLSCSLTCCSHWCLCSLQTGSRMPAGFTVHSKTVDPMY